MAGIDEIRKSLGEMSDAEAIDVLEGRRPAEDSDGVRAAAITIVHGLLEEDDAIATSDPPADTPEITHRGGAEPRQPWMKMAAAMLVGMLVTGVVINPLSVERETAGGAVTANVVFLDNMRSGATDDLPVVSRSGTDGKVSLITYPSFMGTGRLQVYLEHAPAVAENGLPVGEGAWQTLLEQSTGAGTRDSVVILLDAGVLELGIHRIRITSINEDDPSSSLSTALLFRVSD